MAKARADLVLRSLRSRVIPSNLTDRELIERFTSGDKSAFAELVTRHTPMVLGVCQRVLPTIQDAEDACQAVFLILVGKVQTDRWKHSIANWLYTTARQVAFRAQRAFTRRVQHEVQATSPKSITSPLDQMTGREAFLVLDEELAQLPDNYREPLVLCCLEGLTREEAAARLGWTPGSVKARLERGRKQLSVALTRRGIVLGATLLAVVVTSPVGAYTRDLFGSILAAVDGSPSTAASTLVKDFLMRGFFTKAKMLAVLVAGTVGLGLGIAAMPPTAEPNKRESSGLHISGAVLDIDVKPNTNVPDDAKPPEKVAPTYSLKEGELLKLIPPTAESRGDIYQQLMQGSNIPHERMLMVINSDGTQLKLKLATSRERVIAPGGGLQFTGCPLGKLIEHTFGVAATDIIGDEDVLKTMVDVDVLMRTKVAQKKMLAALAKELKVGNWGEFTIVERELDLTCVVAKGEYKLADKAVVDLFSDARQPEPAATHYTTTDQFLKTVANFIGVSIVDESNLKKLDKVVTIHEHFQIPATNDTRAVDCDPDKVLKNLAGQTGLTFKLAKRKQRLIFIDRMDEGNKK